MSLRRVRRDARACFCSRTGQSSRTSPRWCKRPHRTRRRPIRSNCTRCSRRFTSPPKKRRKSACELVSRIGVGVDVGGTFTDLVAIDASGSIDAHKVLSTPADQSEAVATALESFEPSHVERIVHGTTVATNALLERRGARVVLCATRGFTDVIALRRQDRAALYDLSIHHPRPLVDRDAVVAVEERISPDGIVVALSETEADRVVTQALALKPDIVAICLLHAY